jgi:energy-coupling factor transporter ATP-binding protein EcfA2
MTTPHDTPTATDGGGLVGALEEVGDALRRVRLPLELPGVAAHRAARQEMIGQLEDYVLPRLRQIEAPLLAVVGGSTGAGKSTLVNSVVGLRVTEPGVLRPTTRSPVLAFNPADRGWFDDTRILPELARSSSASTDPRSLQLVPVDTVPVGLAILDAPDIDSVEVRNRTLATQLLAAADLWLFVTSAARYADQVPWDFLKAAAERSAAVAIVLDRIPDGARDEVATHLQEMLAERGLGRSPLFTVEEGEVDDHGLLPAADVAAIRQWLEGLAADAGARAAVVRQTLDGAVHAVARRSVDVAGGHAAQVEMVGRLRSDAHRSYDAALRDVSEASADGSLLRGEVLARWQEFVGTGELFRNLETRIGWVRDRVGGWFRGKPQQAERVTVAVESGLESLLVEHAEAAAERTWESWSSVEAGKQLLDAGAGRDLGRASREFRGHAERAVRDWQQGVLEMVRHEGADKRKTARFLAFGFNTLSVALMIVVFASTAGVTGAEVGIAGGSAVLGQKLLEAVFGDQAVRRLADQARRDLEERVAKLFAGESMRYADVLDGLGLDAADTSRLREAADAVDRLRPAERA